MEILHAKGTHLNHSENVSNTFTKVWRNGLYRGDTRRRVLG